MDWFFNPEKSKFFTDETRAEVARIKTIESALQQVPQSLIDLYRIFNSAIKIQGERIFSDGEFFRQSVLDYYLKLPLRFKRLIDALPNSPDLLNIPPCLWVRHKGTSFPIITPYSDGGQLVLIDPINHEILSVLCCALLTLDACNDKDRVQAISIFILKTILVYAPDRDLKNAMESLMVSSKWENDLSSLQFTDLTVIKRSEDLAFNMVVFSSYHEISHSLLGHLKNEFNHAEGETTGEQATRKMREEKEADTNATEAFKKLINTPPDIKDAWHGPQYAHAPISFFRVMQFAGDIQNLRYGSLRRVISKTHPSLDERIFLVSDKLASMNEFSAKDHVALIRGMELVREVVTKTNLLKII